MLSTVRRIAIAALAAGALFANPILAQDDVDDKPKNSTVSAATNSTREGQSTFVAPDKSISFGFTVPEVRFDDYYFTIRVSRELSWGAIGLGRKIEGMDGALVFMIYMNEAGNNVTFSPRAGHGFYEPVYYPDFKYTVLPGTGIFDDHMVFSARCTDGCQNWPSGWMDVADSDQMAIFATGPKEGFASDDPAASVRYHDRFGSFRIDMRRTFGNADAPLLDDKSTNLGTKFVGAEDGKSDKKSILHAVVMIFVFVGMMPLGTLLLRVGGWVRWHALNQSVAMLGVFGGLALGIFTSLHYTRSRSFNTPHQIIGFILVAFVVAQFTLGFLHHKAYKRTQRTTKMAPVHVWLGRFIIFMGTINAFLGFPLALKPRGTFILAGIVILVFGASAFLLVGRKAFDRLLGKSRAGGPSDRKAGYNPEPWRNADTHGGGYGGHQEYSPTPQQIGLMDVKSPRRPESRENNDLGPIQSTKDFV